MTVRTLTTEDIPAYVALRREMLADSPWSFASSPEDDRGLDPSFLSGALAETGQAIVGAFDDAEPPRLAGAAGLYRDRHIKMAHRARIWGVYVTPAARGRGLGESLIKTALGIARSWPGVNSVGLSVSVRSESAMRLYQRLGFVAWGREPDTVAIDGRLYDEIHMIRRLTDPA